MPQGRVDLKLGKGPDARYVTVVVDVVHRILRNQPGWPTKIALAKPFGKYEAAVMFGASYAARCIPLSKIRDGLEITIADLVDTIGTTDVMVVLATARAVWKAVNYQPTVSPYVDEASGGITFPLVLSPGSEDEESHHVS